MKPAETYHQVPHPKGCDCLSCKLIRRVQQDAYDQGRADAQREVQAKPVMSEGFTAGDMLDRW